MPPSILDCDVLVIGGGIHGVGVAQAAAAAGHEVILLEQNDLASGTSSKSSKLIHGGLRYLESADLALVRESLRERELLLRLAPDLVRRQKFFIPVYKHTTRGPWLIRAGLSLYALLAGMGDYNRFISVGRDEWPSLDGLETDGLRHVFQYWDAQTDDAELTRAVMDSARELGATLLCPARFEFAEINKDGCEISYSAEGSVKRCRAATVVNAAGPWARRIANQFSPAVPDLDVENVQGTHLELPVAIEKGCYYVESPRDRRAVFVMPWKHGRTLLGTTENPYGGDPGAVEVLSDEISYLLEVYQHYFPGRSAEVLDQWVGLRVLPATHGSSFKRSRETQLPVDSETTPRVVSIFGGKLTGYRATATRVLELLKRTLPAVKARADTSELPLRRSGSE
jgi:glycerol-3-phosphate dehydrogenase